MDERSVFFAVADYCIRKGLAPVKGKIVTVKLDDQWSFAINGFMEQKEVAPPSGESDVPVSIPPASVYVEFNGWPAGIFNPYGGEFAAGALANESTFIKALDLAS